MNYSDEERAILLLETQTDLEQREKAALLRAAKNPARILSGEGDFLAVLKEDRRKKFLWDWKRKLSDAEKILPYSTVRDISR